MVLTRDQVFKEWKSRRMGKIPEIVMIAHNGWYKGEIRYKGRTIITGNDASKHRDALESAKRWRIIWMGRKLYPGKRIYVK